MPCKSAWRPPDDLSDFKYGTKSGATTYHTKNNRQCGIKYGTTIGTTCGKIYDAKCMVPNTWHQICCATLSSMFVTKWSTKYGTVDVPPYLS